MKKILCLLLFLLSFSAFAGQIKQIPLYGYAEVEGMFMIDLDTHEMFPKVNLDCHSFLKGVNFYGEENMPPETFYLDVGPCYSLMDELRTRLRVENVCLLLDADYGEFLVQDISECEKN